MRSQGIIDSARRRDVPGPDALRIVDVAAGPGRGAAGSSGVLETEPADRRRPARRLPISGGPGRRMAAAALAGIARFIGHAKLPGLSEAQPAGLSCPAGPGFRTPANSMPWYSSLPPSQRRNPPGAKMIAWTFRVGVA